MPMTFNKKDAVLEGFCSIEEAETLLEWLLSTPKGQLNLQECEHLHTAILQVLMVIRPVISKASDSPSVQQALIAIDYSLD